MLSHDDIDDDGGEAPQRISVVIVGDDNSENRTEAALVGMSEKGGWEGGGECVRGGSFGRESVAVGDDENESAAEAVHTLSSDSDDSDCSLDGFMDNDEEEGPY